MTKIELIMRDTTVSVEIDKDDMDINEVWDDLVRPVLLGAGYSDQTVEKLGAGEPIAAPKDWDKGLLS